MNMDVNRQGHFPYLGEGPSDDLREIIRDNGHVPPRWGSSKEQLGGQNATSAFGQIVFELARDFGPDGQHSMEQNGLVLLRKGNPGHDASYGIGVADMG